MPHERHRHVLPEADRQRDVPALTVGSLFSGIGGIDLGLERAGMRTRWFVEWDAHCQNVLRRHWPGVPVYGDITTVDWGTVEPVDVLAGGFPCQPFSNAGKRRGVEDDRWLWPEFARAIRALRPGYVFVENVPALLGRGFGNVISDLAALGYDAEWDCIPASAVGAPHQRDRLWLLAYPRSGGGRWGIGEYAGRGTSLGDRREDVAYANGGGRQVVGLQGATRQPSSWRNEPDRRGSVRERLDASPVGDTYFAGSQGHGRLEQCAREQSAWSDGEALPDGRLAPPGIPRVAHGVPHRVDRLRSIGNAVVPQVVEYIGRAIVAAAEKREAAAA